MKKIIIITIEQSPIMKLGQTTQEAEVKVNTEGLNDIQVIQILQHVSINKFMELAGKLPPEMLNTPVPPPIAGDVN